MLCQREIGNSSLVFSSRASGPRSQHLLQHQLVCVIACERAVARTLPLLHKRRTPLWVGLAPRANCCSSHGVRNPTRDSNSSVRLWGHQAPELHETKSSFSARRNSLSRSRGVSGAPGYGLPDTRYRIYALSYRRPPPPPPGEPGDQPRESTAIVSWPTVTSRATHGLSSTRCLIPPSGTCVDRTRGTSKIRAGNTAHLCTGGCCSRVPLICSVSAG